MTSYKYKAFVSYSHVDDQWVRWLHRALERYKVPKQVVAEYQLPSNRISPIFRDRDELASASDLSATIKTALESSEYLIVVCSKAAAKSHWVNEEIRVFKQLGRSDRILCLLTEDPEISIPAAVLADEGLPLKAQREPLAADARSEFDGRQKSIQKLVAGMLGVGLDDLRQREQHRRYRQMTTVASVSVALLVVMALLTSFAFIARTEAEQQRQRAEQEAASLEATIGFLVGLFEVNDPYSQKNAGDVDGSVRAVFDRGAKRITSDLQSQPHVQARLRQVFGQVYHGLGLYDDAEDMLHSSVEGFERLLGADDPKVARALEELARINGTKGRHELAEQQLRRALTIWQASSDLPTVDEAMVLNRLSVTVSKQNAIDEGVVMQQRAVEILETTPNPPLDYLVLTYHTLGWVLYEANRLQEAATAFNEALDLLAEINIPGQEIQTRASLGSVYMKLGRLDQARRIHEESLELKRTWFGPNHPELAYSHNNIAWVAHETGDYDTAINHYQQAIDAFSDTLGEDHTNVAVVKGNMAEALGKVGRFGDAIAISEAAATTLVANLGSESQYLMSTLIGYGRNCKGSGNLKCAEQKFSRALSIGQSIAPTSRATALAATELAALPNAPMDALEKDAAFEKALAILAEEVDQDHPDRAEVLANHAHYLATTNRLDQAAVQFERALSILKAKFGESSPRYTVRRDEYAALF